MKIDYICIEDIKIFFIKGQTGFVVKMRPVFAIWPVNGPYLNANGLGGTIYRLNAKRPLNATFQKNNVFCTNF